VERNEAEQVIQAERLVCSSPEAGTELELKIPAAMAYQSRGSRMNWSSPRRSSDVDTT